MNPISFNPILTTIIHTPYNTVQLQRRLNETRQPQREEHETPHDDYPGEEEALHGQD